MPPQILLMPSNQSVVFRHALPALACLVSLSLVRVVAPRRVGMVNPHIWAAAVIGIGIVYALARMWSAQTETDSHGQKSEPPPREQKRPDSKPKPAQRKTEPAPREPSTPRGDPTCSVCMENRIDNALQPCGHTFCQACAHRVEVCPTCRRTIKSRFKIYVCEVPR